MDEFNKYSDYYDLIYKDKNYEKESEYIIKIIRDYCDNCKKILELGCGTGKHASYIAKHYKIFAIDASESMLKSAAGPEVRQRKGFQHV